MAPEPLVIAALVLLATLTSEDSLIGVWSSRMTFGPEMHGQLTVTRDGARWRGSIARSEVSSDAIRFDFSGVQFRGALTRDERAIEGWWLQPSGETEDRRDPGGSGQPFATPVVLRRVSRNVWRGDVRPLEDHFTLHLKIFRNEKGTLVGAFRNPEQNSNGGFSQFRVARDGETVSFERDSVRHTATLLHSPERLRIHWPDLGRAVELERRTPPDFFPRTPGEKYQYRRPPALRDGWETARARDAGIDESALARVVQRVIDSDPAAGRPMLMHSMLVAYRGRLVLEEYFFGYDRDTPHDLRSAGKTFASVMLGAAMMRGTKIAPESHIYELLAAKGPFANPDPRKSQITLAHLLTHSAGLACNDNDEASPGNEGTMQSQSAQPDWWKYTLDLPMAHDPGVRYAYCSANINLAGGALTNATKTWLPELFDRTVARPLQFSRYHWNLMPTGEGYLGGGAFLLPRDLLKVGQTYLDGGVWRGKRIVEESWIARSTAPYMKISPETTGLTGEQFSESYSESVDGYAWHVNPIRAGDRTYREYEASGNGGQVLIVVPELDLVVVFTGGNYMQGGIWGRWRSEVVGNEIIPAIRR